MEIEPSKYSVSYRQKNCALQTRTKTLLTFQKREKAAMAFPVACARSATPWNAQGITHIATL